MNLDELLGIDPSDPMNRNAEQLVVARRQMMDNLTRLRIERGLSQADVAERLGCTEERVVEIELWHEGVTLQVLAVYALAIGAAITFKVQSFEEYERHVGQSVTPDREAT